MTEEINATNDVVDETTSESNHAANSPPNASNDVLQTNLSSLENASEPESPAVEEKPRPSTPPPILTTSGKKRPPYTYDPNKVTLRFIFANRDGLAVTIECKPADTVGDVKGALLSVWPEGTCLEVTWESNNYRLQSHTTTCFSLRRCSLLELPTCSGGDRLRLVCMGKGILMPDARSLEDCQVPVFRTHPTPINVSIKPENAPTTTEKQTRNSGAGQSAGGNSNTGQAGSSSSSQGCACSVL